MELEEAQRYKERVKQFREAQNSSYDGTYGLLFLQVEDREIKKIKVTQRVLLSMILLNRLWICETYLTTNPTFAPPEFIQNYLMNSAAENQVLQIVDRTVFLQLGNIYSLAIEGKMEKEDYDRFDGIFKLFLQLHSTFLSNFINNKN